MLPRGAVHDRSIDTDMLCLFARRLVESHPTIRLILMSATISNDLYEAYFGVSTTIFVGAKVSISFFLSFFLTGLFLSFFLFDRYISFFLSFLPSVTPSKHSTRKTSGAPCASRRNCNRCASSWPRYYY
jgi:hypothetical protein